MFTLVGYSQSQDTGGALTYVNALADQHVRVEGYNIVVPPDVANLAGVHALGATISQARVESPSLRRTVMFDVNPLDVGAEPTNGFLLNNLFTTPIPLEPYEVLRAQVAETVAGAEYDHVLVWLADGPLTPVEGEIYTVRATSSTTLTAYTWTNCSLTLGQTLPSGRYQAVGMRAISAGAIAARLVFVGQAWRPGCIAFDANNDVENPVFRRGQLGVWGEFTHDQPPTVDFLSVSADSIETVFLDIIKVA